MIPSANNPPLYGSDAKGSAAHVWCRHHLCMRPYSVLGVAADVDHFARVEQIRREELERQMRLDDPRLVGRQVVGVGHGVVLKWFLARAGDHS